MSDHRLDILRELIAIPSVNPGEREPDGRASGEARIAGWLEKQMRGLGLETEIEEYRPGRVNVYGRFINIGRPVLLLDSHLDTVPVLGMKKPFEPVIKEGRICGRGSCDTKATMAVFITAIKELKEEGRKPVWEILVSGTADEELYASGAYALANRKLKLDAMIFGEPTSLDVVNTHKGVSRFRIRAEGISAHSAEAESGENAILKMAEVLSILKKKQQELDSGIKHDILGSPSISPGLINGGTAINIVPDSCCLDVDVRTVPGFDTEELFDELRNSLKECADAGVGLEGPLHTASPLFTDADNPVCQLLHQSARSQRNSSEIRSASFATNAQAFPDYDIPKLVFGPGDIRDAHSDTESLDIEEYNTAVNILKDFLIKE